MYIERINSFWAYADINKAIKANHIALYMSLLRYADECGWKERLLIDWPILLQYCGLSRNTYYKCMQELHDLGVIEYSKGVNNLRFAEVKLLDLSKTETSEAAPEQVPAPVEQPEQALEAPPGEASPASEVGLDIAQNMRIVEQAQCLCEYFGFEGEFTYYQQRKQATNFIRYLHLQQQEEHFEEQFDAYKRYKALSAEKRHSFNSFIGKPTESYQDGGWNAENWQKKLSEYKTNANGKKPKTGHSRLEVPDTASIPENYGWDS